MKKINSLFTSLILLSLLLLGSGCAESEASLPYANIDNAQLEALKAQGVQIVDIRRPEEWRQTGIVEGSRPLTAFNKNGQLAADFLPSFNSSIAKDQPVILICRTGNRSSTLARYLTEQQGYSTVYNVQRGITGWLKEKNPVNKVN